MDSIFKESPFSILAQQKISTKRILFFLIKFNVELAGLKYFFSTL